MYNEKGDESVNKLLLFYASSKRNIVCNANLSCVVCTRLRSWEQFSTGGTEDEFLKIIIIQIESIAAWLSYEGVCFLFNYGVATFHDEIGSWFVLQG